MKRIIRSVQTLGDQAARLSAAASQLPGRVAEIRQSVAATAGELRNLKSDIQFNVAELQVGSENHLATALMEINNNAKVLEDAGFEVEGVDLELSPAQRLVVHLLRIGDADDDEFRHLIETHQSLTTIRAILASLLKARSVAATIDIGGLDYHRVLIGIGANPIIRLCWRPPVVVPTRATFEPVEPPAPLVSTTGSSFFGPGDSFFPNASRPAAPTHATDEQTEPTPEPPPLPSAAAGSSTKQSPPPLPASTDPLARFKKMPNLGSKP